MKTNQFKIFKVSSLFVFILIATQSCMVSSLHPLYTNKDRVYKSELCGKWQGEDKMTFEITTAIDSSKLIFNRKYPSDFTLNSKEEPDSQTFYEHLTTSINSSKSISRKRNTFTISSAGNEEKKNTEGTEKVKDDLKQIVSELMESELKSAQNQYYQIKMIQKNDTIVFEGRLAKLEDFYFLDIIPDDNYLEKRINNDNLIGLVVPMHGFFKIQFIDENLKLNWIEPDDFKKLRKGKKIRLKTLKQKDREIITAETSDIQKFLVKFADSELFNNGGAELILKPVK